MSEHPVKKLKKEEYSSDEDSQSNYNHDDSRTNYDDDVIPSDYHCTDCKATMNSLATWHMHIAGRKHQRKMASSSFGYQRKMKAPKGAMMQTIKVSGAGPTRIAITESKEKAQMQDKFEDLDDIIVGLDYVNEIWRQDSSLEPVYDCTLCNSECHVLSIPKHVIGFRHRMSYIEKVDPRRYKILSASKAKKSNLSEDVAHFARELQNRHGMGNMKVLVEVKSESSSDESEPESQIQPSLPPIELELKAKPALEVATEIAEAESPERLIILEHHTLSNLSEIQTKHPVNQKKILELLINKKCKEMSIEQKTTIVDALFKGDTGPYRQVFKFHEIAKAARDFKAKKASKSK